MLNKLNCIIISTIVLLIGFNNQKCDAHGEEVIVPYALNSFVGYQYGFGNKVNNIKHAIDIDFVFVLINGGYSYKIDYGSNAYVGLGLGSILQFQYGYAYKQKENLFRIRTDVPLTSGTNGGNTQFWRAFSIGIYYEKRFKNPKISDTFGFTISIGVMNIFQTIQDKKDKK